MLSNEETEEIKQKLLSHIESTFPTEQVINAKKQVELMNSEQLENFLEKNKLIKEKNSDANSKTDECVFCSIASGKIRSIKIDENEDAIAVLEINPISKGHSLIIPKNHVDESSKKVSVLAKNISKKIKEKLEAKRIEISNTNLFGHKVINILPVYGDESFDSKRKSAKIEELEKIKEELERGKEKIQKKPKSKKIKKFFWLPKRIP
jgi:histidine triad (HIT) family protein